MRMGRIGLIVAALVAAAAAFAAAAASAQPAEQSDLTETTGFLRVTIAQRTVRLETLIVKRKNASGALPVALIAHGKPPTVGRMLDDRATDHTRQARDLARRGWLAVVVMRRGFGGSDGPQPAPASCASTSLLSRFAADADDLQAALEALGKRPDADPARVLAIGVSAGGAAVTALAARNPQGLIATVNVSGGLRFQSCPKEDLLVAAFRQYGTQSRVPSLWIYAKNDSYFPPELVDRMQSAFLDGGGDVKLVMLEADERFDGHFIFGLTVARSKWLPQLDAFLRFHKLPTWTRDDATALLKKLDAKETSRGFVESYLAGPSERALARQKSGSYMWASYGVRSPQDARQNAVDNCEKRGKPCEVIMVNDDWVGPAGARQAD
jgi:dienelactone hydrolase